MDRKYTVRIKKAFHIPYYESDFVDRQLWPSWSGRKHCFYSRLQRRIWQVSEEHIYCKENNARILTSLHSLKVWTTFRTSDSLLLQTGHVTSTISTQRDQINLKNEHCNNVSALSLYENNSNSLRQYLRVPDL